MASISNDFFHVFICYACIKGAYCLTDCTIFKRWCRLHRYHLSRNKVKLCRSYSADNWLVISVRNTEEERFVIFPLVSWPPWWLACTIVTSMWIRRIAWQCQLKRLVINQIYVCFRSPVFWILSGLCEGVCVCV